MSEPVKKNISGYNYFEENGDWAVDTDYMHGKIYLSAPTGDENLSEIKAFGRAIVKAVEDMRKDTQQKAS